MRKVFKTLQGDPLGFLKIQFDAKYFKKMKGGTFGETVFAEKVSQSRKK